MYVIPRKISAAALFAACSIFALFPSHVRAVEAPANICLDRPTPECFLEEAQDALDSAGPFDATDPTYIALTQHYVERRQAHEALLNARSIKDPISRSQQLLTIARLNAASGETTQAEALFDDIFQQLKDPGPNKACARHSTALHDALLAETLLREKAQPLESRPIPVPLLRDAVEGSLVTAYSAQQKLALARSALDSIGDPVQKDLAYLPYAETQLQNVPVETVVAEAAATISTPSLREEFMTLRLPRALAARGEAKGALEWTHKIPSPEKRAHAFLALAEALIDQKDVSAAAPMLEAARGTAAGVTDAYERSAVLKTLGKLTMRTGNVDAARAAFADALAAALSIEYLPRRLSAVISILENQREAKDMEGLHVSAFAAIRAGLFEAIDAYGKPEETNRFLNVLDERLTPNDTMEILSHVIELKTPVLRQRILHKLSVLRPSADSAGEFNKKLFKQVAKKAEKYTDNFETVQMLILLSSIAEQMQATEQAAEFNRKADVMLRRPLQLELPAAVIVTRQAQGWRFYARVLLANGHREEALDAFRRTINTPVEDDPQAELFLEAMMQKDLVTQALQFYPFSQVGLAAAKTEGKLFPKLLGYITGGEKEQEDKERLLHALFLELGRAEQWSHAYDVLKILRQYDEDKWFWQEKLLAEPADEVRTLVAMTLLDHKDYALAAAEASRLKAPDARGDLMLRMARKMPEEMWKQPRKPLPPLPELPGPTLEALCKAH